MRVGLIAEGLGMVSLKYVFQAVEEGLSAKGHKVIHRPMEFFYASPRRRDELHEEFLRNSDLLIGRIDEAVLRVRERAVRQPPLIGYMLGTMSRGASDLARLYRFLKSTDVFVGNCTGDVEIARNFFSNAQVRLLPFSFDETTFYPADESLRQSIKEEMNFGPDDRILLYSGRMTLEKNLHTLLKLFSVLQDLVPNLHLIIAGELENVAFAQNGVYSLDITATIMRLMEELRLNAGAVHFLGKKNPKELRNLYAIADLAINMTLHHDENFGFAQVEAMACGTPVVGTSWGGLKDTIKHGETGYQISTVVTDSGVKINWWEAINRIVHLLEDDEAMQQLRQHCPAHAKQMFSKTRYAETLDSIITDCVKNARNGSEPVKLTPFGDQYWLECQPRSSLPPPYQRGPHSFALYKELIGPFTGTTDNSIPEDNALQPDQLLLLAVPTRLEQSTIQPDDPLYPIPITVPEEYLPYCGPALEIFRKEPVIQVQRLETLLRDSMNGSSTNGHSNNGLRETVKWLLSSGVLLRTKLIDESLTPDIVDERMGKPLFSIQNIDYKTDVIVIRPMQEPADSGTNIQTHVKN